MVGSCNRRPRYDIIPQKVTSVAIIGNSGHPKALTSRRSGGTTGTGGVIGRAEYNRTTAAYYRTVSRLKKRGLLTSRGMGLWITDEGMRVAEGLSVSTPRYGHPSPAVLALSGRSYVVSSSLRSRRAWLHLLHLRTGFRWVCPVLSCE